MPDQNEKTEETGSRDSEIPPTLRPCQLAVLMAIVKKQRAAAIEAADAPRDDSNTET